MAGLCALVIIVLSAPLQADTPGSSTDRGAPQLGFLAASRAGQQSYERAALDAPTPQSARATLRRLTEEPHVAGTPEDYDTAVYVRDELAKLGFEAELAEYHVLLNHPGEGPVWVHPSLRLVAPTEQDLPVIEEPNDYDKDSTHPRLLPAFHGYGAGGSATGEVVYANYGREEDFKALEGMGITVKGRIVLVRYGGLFRGLKVKFAQQRGAAGVLIYSDPADDGYMRGDIYPDGPMRPPSAIQRGSVQFLSSGPGDPGTPGYPSLADAKRVAYEDIAEIARIPSLPISYAAAEPILRALGGDAVPEGWQGGLPFAYHVGPGPATVSMNVTQHYAVRPIWNVIATLPGAVEPSQWILVSNHRDAWTFGAADPGSGSTVMLETARALAAAYQAGWRPRRTIKLCSWDGEEYGLLGSVEWGEHHAKQLTQTGALVINVDAPITGDNPGFSGVPSWRDAALECAWAVDDPRSGEPIAKKWLAKQREGWAKSEPVVPNVAEPPFVPMLGTMGSGSDYTVFLDHLGIPAFDLGFGGRYGVYHSAFDNVYWMEHFTDSEYAYHTACARFVTLFLMRAATAEVLPMRFGSYAEALERHVRDLRTRQVQKRRALDPERTDRSNDPIDPDFAGVAAAIDTFRASAEQLDETLAGLERREQPADRLTAVNVALMQVERAFIDDAGLPGRTWFKHVLFAPGATTGYEAWPLPGLRQAIEANDAELFAREAARLVRHIDAARARLDAARQAAERAGT